MLLHPKLGSLIINILCSELVINTAPKVTYSKLVDSTETVVPHISAVPSVGEGVGEEVGAVVVGEVGEDVGEDAGEEVDGEELGVWEGKAVGVDVFAVQHSIVQLPQEKVG